MPRWQHAPGKKLMGERCFGTLSEKSGDCHPERISLASWR